MPTFETHSPERTEALAAELAKLWKPGDVVLLSGELGAGKTTFVRGLLKSFGHVGTVRSPTFNLIQTYPTTPPVMHADLYRLESAEGLGIEDYLDEFVCLIEWPDRLGTLIDVARCTKIFIQLSDGGRTILHEPPARG